MTTIQDTLYNANGALANGRIVINSPAFTMNGVAVAASQWDSDIVDGDLSVELEPNMNAQPLGVYYTVYYELDQGPVFEEYWVVPNLAEVNLGQVRIGFPITPSSMISAQQLTSAGALPGQFLGWSGGNWTPMYVSTFNYYPNFIGLLLTANAAPDLSVAGSPATLGANFTLNVPDAGPASRGVVTTGAQTFAGDKSFSGNLNVSGSVTADGGAFSTLSADSITITGGGGGSNLLIDPTTTLGDLIVRGATAAQRFPLGTQGEVLTIDTAQPLGMKWAPPANAVASVFGRTGAVIAQAGDYSAYYPLLSGSYANPSWIASIPYSKVSGSPSSAQVAAMQTPWLQNIDAAGFQLHNPSMIGVATSAPQCGLDVNDRIRSTNTVNTPSSGQCIEMGFSPGGSPQGWIDAWDYSAGASLPLSVTGNTLTMTGGDASNSMEIYVDSSSIRLIAIPGDAVLSEVMRATLDNTVGIGTAAPAYMLDVAGDVNSGGCYRVSGATFACSNGSGGINLSNITTINGAPPGSGGGGGGGASVTVSDTAPAAPANGNLWFDSVATQLYIWYADPTSSQWVVVVNQQGGGGGGSGGGGATSPLTSKGDIWGYSTTNARVPAGTNGQVLTVNSAAPLGVSWATPAAAAGVTSFNARTGAVLPVSGDYTAAMVTNAVSTLGSYASPSWLTAIPWSIITGAPATGVSSFNTRTGAITPATGDYTAAMVTNAVSTAGSYPDPAWITSLSYGKLTGAPTIPTIAQCQTPWLQNINAAGFQLESAGYVGIGVAPTDPLTVSLPAVGANSYLKILMTGASFATRFGATATNQAAWFTNVYYTGSAFAKDDASYGGWRMTMLVAGATDPANVWELGYFPLSSVNYSARLTVEGDGTVLTYGNIGVNTASPAYAVDVTGDVNVSGVFRVKGTPISTGGQPQTPWAQNIAGANFSLGSVSSIGVGTAANTAAGRLLDLQGNLSGASVAVTVTNSASAGYATFSASGGGYQAFFAATNAPVAGCEISSSGAIGFYVGASTINAMTITSAGLVGVGKAPAYAVDVSGDVNVTGAFRVNGVAIQSSPWLAGTGGIYYSAGSVGVGVAAPAYKLDVRGSMLVANTDWAGSAGSGMIFSLGAASGATYSSIQAWTAGGTAYGNLLLNVSGGSVAIGLISPAAMLHVYGSIFAGANYATGTSAGDICTARNASPSQGAVYFGNSGAYIFYNGSWNFNPALPATGGGPTNMVNAGRAVNTTFSNGTGKPMWVAVSLNMSSASECYVQINGANAMQLAAPGGSSGGCYMPVTFVVLPGQTYRIDTTGSVSPVPSTIYWYEWY